jgi:hypothetical protein
VARDPGGPARAAPRVLVAIVNYRTPALTVECLRSLAAERGRVPWLRAVVAHAA